MPLALITGSSGLVGSEAVCYFDQLGFEVHGIDNNMRMDFFGDEGDTRCRRNELLAKSARFTHHDMDVRNRSAIDKLVWNLKPDLVIHCAAQPSHDLAGDRPFDDFEVNALGTFNLLEAVRQGAPETVFCHMSTNKVYGDAPNRLPLKELPTRYDFAEEKDYQGIAEDFPIDQSIHSLFGVSKLAADLLVQEYGRYFGLKTGSFRGGCLTGPRHAGVELHGFLAYLIKVAVQGGTYRIFGYKGKQVRDNLHSLDVCRAIHAFYEDPRPGEVYNLGGGRENAISILEAVEKIEMLTGKKMSIEYLETHRVGDHICYISNLSKLKEHFPGWDVSIDLDQIFEEIYRGSLENDR